MFNTYEDPNTVDDEDPNTDDDEEKQPPNNYHNNGQPQVYNNGQGTKRKLEENEKELPEPEQRRIVKAKRKNIDITDIMIEHSQSGITTQQSNNPKVKNPIRFLNSLFEKLKKLISRNGTETTSQSSTSTKSIPSIESLITIVISSHSATSKNTYRVNYSELNAILKSVFYNYDDNIIIESGVIDDPKNPGTFKTLLHEDKQSLIAAVPQNICAYADVKKNNENEFLDKYTRDAANLKHIYDKSLNMLESIKADNNNRSTVEKYILNIKDPLNQEDMLRYTNDIIQEYIDRLKYIQTCINYLKQILDLIQTTPNDLQIDGAKIMVESKKRYFNILLTKLNSIKDMDIVNKIIEFQGIIKQPTYPVQWGSPPTHATVHEDIYNLVILRNIIDTVILTNPNIKLVPDTDTPKKDIIRIKTYFSDRTFFAANNDLPLCFGENNDKLIYYDGILNNSFWRSENHELDINDIEIQLRPNSEEKPGDFDCNYGLNIFALMLNLNSPDAYYFLPTSKIHTRSRQQAQLPDWSGTEIYDSSIWRELILNANLNILNAIVEIFKQNFLEHLENDISALKIKLKDKNITTGEKTTIKSQIRLFRFSTYILKTELNNIKITLGLGSPDILGSLDIYKNDADDNDNYEKIFSEKNTLENDQYKVQLQKINKNDPLVFTYCRVIEFTIILKQILIEKDVRLSTLLYFFQYLLQFDYAIYILTSCRGCEDFITNKKPRRSGGNKSKRRINKRKTYKRKRNYNRKTYKRKRNYNRKTYKRK